jgi:hypothetical protein
MLTFCDADADADDAANGKRNPYVSPSDHAGETKTMDSSINKPENIW